MKIIKGFDNHILTSSSKSMKNDVTQIEKHKYALCFIGKIDLSLIDILKSQEQKLGLKSYLYCGILSRRLDIYSDKNTLLDHYLPLIKLYYEFKKVSCYHITLYKVCGGLTSHSDLSNKYDDKITHGEFDDMIFDESINLNQFIIEKENEHLKLQVQELKKQLHQLNDGKVLSLINNGKVLCTDIPDSYNTDLPSYGYIPIYDQSCCKSITYCIYNGNYSNETSLTEKSINEICKTSNVINQHEELIMKQIHDELLCTYSFTHFKEINNNEIYNSCMFNQKQCVDHVNQIPTVITTLLPLVQKFYIIIHTIEFNRISHLPCNVKIEFIDF